ncbi:hypothetical protein [uncultured Shewanella sp.]|uniref:hypothetical protein n=1 Tax=uncultured Shewanella sp. TaxID=173975 RepID=UPI0037037555
MLKSIVVFICVLFLTYFCYSYFNQQNTKSIILPNVASLISSETQTSSSNILNISNEIIAEAPNDIELNTSVVAEDNEDFFNQFNHLTKSHFQSAEQLTSGFINEDGEVSKAALEDSFKVSDFEEFIAKVDAIEKSENATIREATLAQSLYQLEDIQVYSERYSCAGKICLVSFNFDGNDENTAELSKFTDNYSFTNITEGENGAKQFKAVYIETDDPSTLSLSY